MNFSLLYEWTGLYSNDFADFLAGLDLSCENFSGTDFYFWSTISIVLFSIFSNLIFYITNSSSGLKRKHWFGFAFVASFLSAFIINILIKQNLDYGYCSELDIRKSDLLSYSILVFSYTFFLFFILSMFFKRFSIHGKKTPF